MNSLRRANTGQVILKVVSSGEPRAPISRSPSDEDLIQAVINGNDRIAGQLYDRLSRHVDGALFRVFGRREPDHDDLVQTAFEQIVATLTEGRFAGACSLNTWASAIASHVGLRALRSRRRERRVVYRGPGGEADTPDRIAPHDVEQDVSVRRELERIRSHLAAMNESRATTLFLHDVLGHSLAEIAVLTQASVAAAQSRLVRARRELTQRIEAEVREP